MRLCTAAPMAAASTPLIQSMEARSACRQRTTLSPLDHTPACHVLLWMQPDPEPSLLMTGQGMQASIVRGLSPLSSPGQNVSMHVELDDEERQQSLAMRQSLGYVCEYV